MNPAVFPDGPLTLGIWDISRHKSAKTLCPRETYILEEQSCLIIKTKNFP